MQNQSVTVRDEFHFPLGNFARDPFRSYFDEPQKNEIYLLNESHKNEIYFLNIYIVTNFPYMNPFSEQLVHTSMNVSWSCDVVVKRRHWLTKFYVFIGCRNVRLTSRHDDGC